MRRRSKYHTERTSSPAPQFTPDKGYSMQTYIAHMQLNVQAANIGFYQDLLTFLGWKVIAGSATEGWLGIGDGRGVSIWFLSNLKDVPYDYDGPGLNHIGIGVDAQADVDAAAKYIAEHN